MVFGFQAPPSILIDRYKLSRVYFVSSSLARRSIEIPPFLRSGEFKLDRRQAQFIEKLLTCHDVRVGVTPSANGTEYRVLLKISTIAHQSRTRLRRDDL